jgi:hypothetical protein
MIQRQRRLVLFESGLRRRCACGRTLVKDDNRRRSVRFGEPDKLMRHDPRFYGWRIALDKAEANLTKGARGMVMPRWRLCGCLTAGPAPRLDVGACNPSNILVAFY